MLQLHKDNLFTYLFTIVIYNSYLYTHSFITMGRGSGMDCVETCRQLYCMFTWGYRIKHESELLKFPHPPCHSTNRMNPLLLRPKIVGGMIDENHHLIEHIVEASDETHAKQKIWRRIVAKQPNESFTILPQAEET